MSLIFLGNSIVLPKYHEFYDGEVRVKAHFFRSKSGNIVAKSFNDRFHKLAKVPSLVMTADTYNNLPEEAGARAEAVLSKMGWK